jgi:hypothetical protein
MLPNSRKAPQSSAEPPAAQSSASAAQPGSQYKCAGVGDSDAVAHICYDCATCFCVDDNTLRLLCSSWGHRTDNDIRYEVLNNSIACIACAFCTERYESMNVAALVWNRLMFQVSLIGRRSTFLCPQKDLFKIISNMFDIFCSETFV